LSYLSVLRVYNIRASELNTKYELLRVTVIARTTEFN